jgi:leader peptidase (prepilin peptidase)/N-methyltransferase
MPDLILFLSHHMTLYYFLVPLIGILLGSFLNLVIYRLPIMMEHGYIQEINLFLTEHAATTEHLSDSVPSYQNINLCYPRSFCPNCKHALSWWQNIPIFSYLILKFKCYYCHVRISPRYFIIELLTGLLLLTCAYKFGLSWQAFWAMFFSLFLITMAFIDIDHQLLPDSLTLPLLWLGLILSLFGVFIYPNTSIIGASAGYLILWTLYWAFKLITQKEGMGYGDFKLLAALGAWVGWQLLPIVLLLSALSGVLFAIILRCLKKLGAGEPISFGPFLALAGWVSLIWGAELSQFYFNLFKFY